MTAPAAIRATFADYRRIRTRKVGQLVFEISLEELHSAIEALGGEPSVNGDTWCAIALLTPEAAGRGSEAVLEDVPGKQQWDELSPQKQAGIRCRQEAFWRFLHESGHLIENGANAETNAAKAAAHVRLVTGVRSRSEYGTNPLAAAKWIDLERSYQIWLANPEG